ncbi:SusC/RagA family TonB-linked outer membrane protein [Reichenbachiella carrageenanivorans]|uniref:SusC/RagA family TonB-linked outer membrane protein n=1 Tax=Reichenbachiella carrageenanivorans TaxID=2979869 RepID=A0ABY6CY04_9BACT|nr:SusC/RagA family TonB-linked outer membrane protein [Reichenbachiella carrageenanivorans]UXX78790.1 SusC/RagA family TonB-linked outer membrane protein [Reichenbachiella carrageenanivorans]
MAKLSRWIGIGAFVLLSTLAYSQSSNISGKVLDASGEPMVGVSVVIDNTTTGAITDLDGNFKLKADVGNVLVVRMLGMQDQRIKVSNPNQQFSIKLIEESVSLQEVVVNGFQEVDRKLFTGASENLKMGDIEAKGIVDVSRVLEGRVAGVNVDNVSGTFGSSPKIRIRGNASINGNNQPLFVVDGVILEDLSNVNTDDFISGNANTLISSSIANINPDDIESFQILKDASATAIYGARAANGVIVITTKRGKSGALRVNYSGNYSVKLRPTYNQFSLLNSAEEMSVYREMQQKGLIDITTSVKAKNYGSMGKMYTKIANHEIPWGAGGGLNEAYLNPYENANTDWFDVLFRDFGLQQQHSLSFTSGTDKSNSYYSISYLNDAGQTIADQVQRLTASSRNTYFLSEKFTFGLKLSASYRDQKVPGTRNREFDPITGKYSRGFDINPLSYALNTSRSIRPYDSNGELEYFRRNYADFNILEELSYNFIDINVTDVSTQTDFELNPVKNLSLKGVMQLRYAATQRDHTVHERSNQAEAYRANNTQFIQDANNLLYRDPDNPGLNPVVVLPVGGFNYLDKTDMLNFFSRVSAEWSKTFSENHQVNVLAGQELRFTNRAEKSTTGLGVVYESGGISVPDPNIIKFFNSQNIEIYSQNELRDRFVGLFLNGGYAYKGKYIANFTVRYDGSNQLGESKNARYLPTWNVSGAWNVHNEAFMSNLSLINQLKIRGTYGVSGNLPPDASALLNLQANVTVRPTDQEPYLYIKDLTNTELTWEKLKELNIGVDVSLLDNRINTSIDWYSRQSFDLIGQVLTSGVGGQSIKTGNFADMESQGFEFTLNTVNMTRGDFSWTSNFNVGYTKDRITRLDYGPRLVDALSQNGAAVLGGPRRGLYSSRFAGLSSTGFPTFYDENDGVVFQYDLQSRENLTETLKYEGSTEPRGSGGLSNTFSWKGLSFSFLLSYKFDYKIRLNDVVETDAQYTDFDALPAEMANRWVVPGDENTTNVPAILDQQLVSAGGEDLNAYSLYNLSDIRVADGDYIRLKNVRLSYQLPSPWVQKIGLNNVNMSIEGQNLWLIYSDDALNGQDPEFFSSGGVSLPQPRLVTFSLNIGI